MVCMFVRHATLDDLDALTSVEAACFPPREAADSERLATRIEKFPEHFWLLINPDVDPSQGSFPAQLEDGMLVSFINGMTTDTANFEDAMFSDAAIHNEDGCWQMILGVDTAPLYQHHGFAGYLMRRVILDCAINHRAGIVLTCKEKLVSFYESFGFVDEGVCPSSHGGVSWHQMRLVFDSSLIKAEDALRFVNAHQTTAETIRLAMEETTHYMDNESTTGQFPAIS